MVLKPHFSLSHFRLESDRIRGRDPDPRGGRSHDPAHGATVPYPDLHLLLRPRRRLRRRHELRRQLRALGLIHVRTKRLQATLPTEGMRDMGLKRGLKIRIALIFRMTHQPD